MDILDRFTEDTQDKLYRAMLESSLMFSMNRSQGITLQRNEAFLKTVFAFIISEQKPWTIGNLQDSFQARYHKQISKEEIQGAVDKLVSSNWLRKESGGYIPHESMAKQMEKGINEVKDNTKLLMDGLIKSVAQEYGKTPSLDEVNKLTENIENTFNLYFRMYGLNYVLSPTGVKQDTKPLDEEDLIDATKKGLNEDLGNALLQVLSNLIENPDNKQTATLMLWVKTIVGLQVMQLDPQLSQLESNKLKNKNFVLDTDFLLYCLCTNCPQSKLYRQLIKALRKAGSELIVPNEVCVEIVKHAQCAESNYHYYKNRLESVDKAVVEKMANNIFVKDYCLAKFEDNTLTTLKKYLHDKYLSDKDPLGFIKDVIRDELRIEPKIDDYLNIATEYLYYQDDLTQRILERTRKSEKDKMRSDEETKSIAETDSKLYLGVLSLNKDDMLEEGSGMLDANTYLVTYTTKGIKSAREIGLNDSFVTRPELLLNLLSEIGEFDDNKNFVNLFDNPFLAHIIDQNWDIIRKLSETGVDLRSKSLTRLNRDLGEVVHRYLTNNADNDEISTETDFNLSYLDKPEDFYDYVRAVERRHYQFMPDAQKMIEEHKTQEKTIEETKRNYERTKALLDKKSEGYLNYMFQMGRINDNTRRKNLGYKAKKKR